VMLARVFSKSRTWVMLGACWGRLGGQRKVSS
jgi:hypothetical protein